MMPCSEDGEDDVGESNIHDARLLKSISDTRRSVTLARPVMRCPRPMGLCDRAGFASSLISP